MNRPIEEAAERGVPLQVPDPGVTLRELVRQLRQRQRRLGTSLESPDDFDASLVLAHDINNALTLMYLIEAMNGVDCSKQKVREQLRDI